MPAAAARRANVTLMVGHVERFNPAVAAIKQAIAAVARRDGQHERSERTAWNAGLEQTVATRTHELQVALESAVAARAGIG